MYSVKEIFYTLQGEGTHSGRPAVFVRFSGCNLWSGREKDRDDAVCQFCDTEFVGADGLNGGKFSTADQLADRVFDICEISEIDKAQIKQPLMVVCTGGEPLLQLDDELIKAFQARGFYVAVESNGTIKAPSRLDWLCVSPKAGSEVLQTSGNELKVVYGQKDLNLDAFLNWDFDHFYLQPMDCEDRDRLTSEAVDYCKRNPSWKLSLQSHKILDIP